MFFNFFKTQNQSIIIKNEDKEIIVAVKSNKRAKNLKLSIKQDGTVQVSLPFWSSFAKAEEFVKKNEEWIKTKLITKELPKLISIYGKEYKILYEQEKLSKPIIINENEVLISSSVALSKIDDLLAINLKKIAHEQIKILVDNYTSLLNQTYKKIVISNAKTRWGSCSANKTLSFSWRLILAPKDVLEYVVIHEVCHLKEMNHSERFWRLVFQLAPNYFDAKLWLKRNGKKLYF